MATQKMMYGIDLGTTNSALVKMDQGNVQVIKNELQKDTTPSCVSFTKKGSIRVGESALNGFRSDLRASLKKSQEPSTNTFIEFKRTMGTDKAYYSSNIDRSYSSEELSAEVLKKLRTYIDNDPVEAAVITVPAKFRQNQLDATQRAAELAGFKYVELLQEPIAASIAYSMERKNLNGFWLVFDLGGGTFDAALMKVENGVMKVLDTEGDNHLGGKNIDYRIVDEILLPYIREEYTIVNLENNPERMMILRDALKSLAEEVKIQLTVKDYYELLTDEPICLDDNEDAIEVDMEITLKQFNIAAAPIYLRSIDIVKTILKRNNLEGHQLDTILLVGGATFSRSIRELLAAEICPRIETGIDPMIAVAKGAALFASTKNIPDGIIPVQLNRTYLDLFYPETTTALEVQAGIKVTNATDNYTAELIRSDGGWSSSTFPLKSGKGIAPLLLKEGGPNTFRINLFSTNGEKIATEPSCFTIIQGGEFAHATLPYSICVDAYNSKRKTNLLALLPGLEKNQQLPAKGKAVFFTSSDIQPGNKDCYIDISIYEGEPETRAIHNEPIGRVVITGNEIDQFLPANQELELSLEISASRGMNLSVYIPYIDETIEVQLPENKQKEYNAEKIKAEINRIREMIHNMQQEHQSGKKERLKVLDNELLSQQQLILNARGDYNTKTQVVERLRDIAMEVENIEFSQEWPKAQLELREAFEEAEENISANGNDSQKMFLMQLRRAADQAFLNKDIYVAQEVADRVRELSFQIIRKDPEIWVVFLNDYDTRFNEIHWKDAAAAKQIISDANAKRGDTFAAREAVAQLNKLLPREELPPVTGFGKGDIWN